MARFVLDLQKNTKQTAIVIAAAAVVCLIAYFYFLLVPRAVSAFTALADAAKLSAEVKNAESDISRIEKLKNDLSGYNAKIDRYVKMLPIEAEVPAFLENLSVMAKDANVRIVEINPMPGKGAEGQGGRIYQDMPIQISARSGYHELGRFMTNLESSDRFMKVVDIEIKSDKASPKKHIVDLVLLTYVLLKGK